jgi:hypothetical protein
VMHKVFAQSGEKNECFKKVSSLRSTLERAKGESESLCRLCHVGWT